MTHRNKSERLNARIRAMGYEPVVRSRATTLDKMLEIERLHARIRAMGHEPVSYKTFVEGEDAYLDAYVEALRVGLPPSEALPWQVPTDVRSWHLYLTIRTAIGALRSTEGSIKAAKAIGLELRRQVACRPKAEAQAVVHDMLRFMARFRAFGANDTEPEDALLGFVEKAYGLPEHSLSR